MEANDIRHLDMERPCDLVKGRYSLEENGEFMRGSGEGGEESRAGLVVEMGWDGPLYSSVSSLKLGTTSGVVNWALKLCGSSGVLRLPPTPW